MNFELLEFLVFWEKGGVRFGYGDDGVDLTLR